jgi:Family of unknown function (DUF6527)
VKPSKTLVHEFVEYIPDELRDGTIYISTTYGTAVHKCCCGCQNKVVTPLTPRDWKLVFDGETISLHPSIGNWQFPCKSHYWIRESKVVWADKLENRRIVAPREDRNSPRQRNGKFIGMRILDFFFGKNN